MWERFLTWLFPPSAEALLIREGADAAVRIEIEVAKRRGENIHYWGPVADVVWMAAYECLAVVEAVPVRGSARTYWRTLYERLRELAARWENTYKDEHGYGHSTVWGVVRAVQALEPGHPLNSRAE
jgi:hypothetical protein